MNMVCASTYLYLPQFLSSVSYNFLSTSVYVLGYVTPRYLILLETIVNGIVFLISLSVSSFLAYKNAIDFWILVLYHAILLNSFVSSSGTRFLVESLGFFMYSIMSSASQQSFTSSFPIFMPFISSSSMISVVMTSSTMLNKKTERRNPCFCPNLERNIHSYWP